MPKFKKKYVLAEGYPWIIGNKPYYEFSMMDKETFGRKELNFPEEICNTNCPKYRLVLERIDK